MGLECLDGPVLKGLVYQVKEEASCLDTRKPFPALESDRTEF